MKAIIQLDVPEWQIGQEVSVYFPDTMQQKAKCELLKESDITEEDFHFGDWLKAEMKKLDWDIYDLSIESGVPDRTLADYQRNARMPKMRNLQWICQAFGKRLMIKDE